MIYKVGELTMTEGQFIRLGSGPIETAPFVDWKRLKKDEADGIVNPIQEYWTDPLSVEDQIDTLEQAAFHALEQARLLRELDA